jgi:hypothetical protein
MQLYPKNASMKCLFFVNTVSREICRIHEHDFARAIDLLLAHPEVADKTKGIV